MGTGFKMANGGRGERHCLLKKAEPSHLQAGTDSIGL